jgi:PII-like signaling protein
VRACKRDGTLVASPQNLPGTDERGRPLWQKLMVFTSERAMHDGQPVHEALVRRLRQTGSRGATVLRGIWGFQGESAPHGDRVWQLGRRVPVVTVIVDVPERIARSFDVVDETTAEHGVVTRELVPALSLVHHGEQRARLRLARLRF